MSFSRVFPLVCMLAALDTVAVAQAPFEPPEEHAKRYLALVEDAATHRTGPEAGTWSVRVEKHHEDIRRAWLWTLDYGAPDQILRFATAIGLLWERSNPAETRDAVERALQRTTSLPASSRRAELLHRAGVLAFRQNDTRTARARMDASLAMARELKDTRATALALTGLAQVALRENPANVFTYGEEAAALYRELGDRRGAGAPLHMMAEAARMLGDPRAEAMYEQSLELSREMQDPRRVATELHNLAYVKLQRKKTGEANRLFRQSWTIFRELSDTDMDPYILGGLAAVAAAEGRAERAAQLFGASERLFEAMNAAPDPADKVEMDRYAAIAKSQLGDAAYRAVHERGRALSTAAATGLAQDR